MDIICYLVYNLINPQKHSYVVLSEVSLAETRQEREPQRSRIKTQEPIHSSRIMLILTLEVRRTSQKKE